MFFALWEQVTDLSLGRSSWPEPPLSFRLPHSLHVAELKSLAQSAGRASVRSAGISSPRQSTCTFQPIKLHSFNQSNIRVSTTKLQFKPIKLYGFSQSTEFQPIKQSSQPITLYSFNQPNYNLSQSNSIVSANQTLDQLNSIVSTNQTLPNSTVWANQSQQFQVIKLSSFSQSNIWPIKLVSFSQ